MFHPAAAKLHCSCGLYCDAMMCTDSRELLKEAAVGHAHTRQTGTEEDSVEVKGFKV